VTLDGTNSDGDGPLACTWSFENEDGSIVWGTRTGCTIQMTFENADTKYVRLTVTDQDGDTDDNRQSFAVAEAPATTPTPTPTPSPSPTPEPPVLLPPDTTPPLPLPLPSGPISGTGSGTTADAGEPVSISGLIAAYGFDDRGRRTRDASGHRRSARLQGVARTRFGRFGRGLRFDGRRGVVRIPGTKRVDPSRGLTLEAWVRSTVLDAAWRPVIVRAARSGPALGLYASTPTGQAAAVARAGRLAVARRPLRPGTWTHLALTYSGRKIRLYANGVLVAQRTLKGEVPKGRGPLLIGAGPNRRRSFRGQMDEVRVYSRALSARDIRRDMLVPVASGGA
jgi:hypothetical protein